MAKKGVWFIRHGQAQHNATGDSSIPDPHITELGLQQARELPNNPVLQPLLSAHPERRAQLVVASPMTRTLETATEGLKGLISEVPFVAVPLCQEIGTSAADTGQPPQNIINSFPHFDFSEVHDNWFDKISPWDSKTGTVVPEGVELLNQRKQQFLLWLNSRMEDKIVVVSHHGFLCHLLGVEFDNCEVLHVELEANAAGSLTVQFDTSDRLIPSFTARGQPNTHKGSLPLRSREESIRRLQGDAALAFARQNAEENC